MNPSQSDPASSPSTNPAPRPKGVLDWIEWLGNKLPEPALIFAILAAAIIAVSALAVSMDWSVQPKRLKVETVTAVDAAGVAIVNADGTPKLTPKLDEHGMPVTKLVDEGTPIRAKSLLTSEGIYWMLSSMLKNFTTLPALPLIFVAMLGIGVAEKFGLFGASMRALAMATPPQILTPTIVFLGANASVASDAGYIILPPLAAALYLAVGRHPVAGLAAAFCGVSGGFGGGFIPTASDGFLAGVASDAAHIIDANYLNVSATHNWWFKMGSAIVVTLCGWFVTDKIVEPRLVRETGKGQDVKLEGKSLAEMALSGTEKKGLAWAALTCVAVIAIYAAMVFVPAAPLHGKGLPVLADGRVLAKVPVSVHETRAAASAAGVTKEQAIVDEPLAVSAVPGKRNLIELPGDRWSQVIVPTIFLAFLLPGMVYGVFTGAMRNQKDFIDAFYHGIRSVVPILGIMFFLGQFINYFEYTRLDKMLAYAGGSLLVEAKLPTPLLITLFVLLVIVGDFAISGMLSKFAILAPIFIPMFMMVGISPELTTAAYRIGDSVVNVITPMNSYLLVILVVLQKYKPSAGLGTQISLMLPYSVVLFVAWTGFLLLWYWSGFELGTQAPLRYVPGH
jgi:aminobenzoyl-glutamate transport protein